MVTWIYFVDVFHAQHVSLHSSWDRDSSRTLLITHSGVGVQLHHVDGGFFQTEASCVHLNGAEALDISNRIRRVLAGDKGVNPEAVPGQPRLLVCYTNDGEPFREGVALSLESGEYMSDFSFQMSDSTAKDVGSSLKKVAEIVLQVSPAEQAYSPEM